MTDSTRPVDPSPPASAAARPAARATSARRRAAFKDRPYFRRVVDLDGLLRRRRVVTCAWLARRWETSGKTVLRLVDAMRQEFDAPIEYDRERRSYVYADEGYRLPFERPLPRDARGDELLSGCPSLRFRVRLSRAAAPGAETARFHPEQRLELLPNGEAELELPAPSITAARRFVLSFGRDARVLAPHALVEETRREAEAILAAYR